MKKTFSFSKVDNDNINLKINDILPFPLVCKSCDTPLHLYDVIDRQVDNKGMFEFDLWTCSRCDSDYRVYWRPVMIEQVTVCVV